MRVLARSLALFLPIALVAGSAAPVAAWHWEDERTNEKYTSVAGDARILQEDAGCIPAVADDPLVACVVLYAHVLDPLSFFALNVQRPSGCSTDLAQGFTGTPGVEPLWAFSRMAGYVTPGFVEYRASQCEGQPRVHWVVGHAGDIRFSSAFPLTGYWTLSADALEISPLGLGTGPDSIPPSLGAMPCVTVRMVVEDEPYAGTGAIIAEGRTTKTILSAPDGTEPNDLPAADACPGADESLRIEEATQFEVDLGYTEAVIPAGKKLLLRVQWYQWDGGDPDEPNNVVQRDWNLRTGPEHVPRLVFAAEEPFRLLDVQMQEFDAKFFIHAALFSVWALYDVDTQNLRLAIYDDDGARVPLKEEVMPIMRIHSCHACFLGPGNVTFPFDPFAAGLAPGEYTLEIRGTNWQHTASVEWSARLVIERDQASLHSEDGTVILVRPADRVADAPAIMPLVGILAALIVAVMTGRRRASG